MGAFNAVKMEIVSNSIVGIWMKMNSFLSQRRRPEASWLGKKLMKKRTTTTMMKKTTTRLTYTALRTHRAPKRTGMRNTTPTEQDRGAHGHAPEPPRYSTPRAPAHLVLYASTNQKQRASPVQMSHLATVSSGVLTLTDHMKNL